MIKRIFIILVLFLGLSGSSLYAWQIDNFDVNIDIGVDGSFLVNEKIVANFYDKPKHGIIRNIPLQYRDEKGNWLNVRFQIIDISDEYGNHWQYSDYVSGTYRVLKIGSPNKTYTTQKTFIIKYRVTGAILFLDGHDELYWNATGTEWDVFIDKVAVKVRLPQPVEKAMIKAASYTGRFGSRTSKAFVEIIDEQNIFFTASRFSPNEGLTIAVGWPKGIVSAPAAQGTYDYPGVTSSYERRVPDYYPSSKRSFGSYIFFAFTLLLVLVLPLTVFLVMFNIWSRYGKDPVLHKSIVVEYKAPEGIKPAEMGILIDDKVDIRDISATIIDLAVRGYLKIEEGPKMFFQKSYSFVRLKDPSDDKDLSSFEKTIIEGIFGYAGVGQTASLDSLENKFYKKLPLIKEKVCSELIKKNFYTRDPEKVANKYRALAFVVLFIAICLLIFIPLGISLLLCAAIIFGFAKYMPAKTRKGMDVYGKILGFEEFLTRTDKEKIQFQERQNIFEKMLPYAICLGISSQWAKVFVDIYKQSPDWYTGDYPGGFSMDSFICNLNRSVVSMNSAFVSAPRTVSSGGGFSGGGSSGGGFGGGGGSSW